MNCHWTYWVVQVSLVFLAALVGRVVQEILVVLGLILLFQANQGPLESLEVLVPHLLLAGQEDLKKKKVNSPHSINVRSQGGNSRPFRTALKNNFCITNAWIQILRSFRIHKKRCSCYRPSNSSFPPSLHYLFCRHPITPAPHTEQSHPQHIPLYLFGMESRHFKYTTPDTIIPWVYNGSILFCLLFLF